MEWQNEYAKQIREYRTLEKSGKTHGKVFVRGEWLADFKLFEPNFSQCYA